MAQKAEAMNGTHSAILLSLENEVLREVVNKTIITDLWKKLESRYQKSSLSNNLYQKKAAAYIKDIKRHAGRKHLDKFNRIVSYLKGVGVDIDDKDQAIFLLHSLPG